MTLFTESNDTRSDDMNPHSPKRRRIEVEPDIQRLWESTWRDSSGTAVPFCTRSNIVRDHSLSDGPADVPYWTMQPPQAILPNMSISGFLIRDDYIVVLEHLFKAAGFDCSKICKDWPEIFTNPFLNVLATADDPKFKTKKGGLIITGHPGIGVPLMLYKIKG